MLDDESLFSAIDLDFGPGFFVLGVEVVDFLATLGAGTIVMEEFEELGPSVGRGLFKLVVVVVVDFLATLGDSVIATVLDKGPEADLDEGVEADLDECVEADLEEGDEADLDEGGEADLDEGAALLDGVVVVLATVVVDFLATE